jgi:hypothetical protein
MNVRSGAVVLRVFGGHGLGTLPYPRSCAFLPFSTRTALSLFTVRLPVVYRTATGVLYRCRRPVGTYLIRGVVLNAGLECGLAAGPGQIS